jgi:hypothetical protein
MENMALEDPFPSFSKLYADPNRTVSRFHVYHTTSHRPSGLGTGGQIAICLGKFIGEITVAWDFFLDPLQPFKHVWRILAGLYLPIANDIVGTLSIHPVGLPKEW